MKILIFAILIIYSSACSFIKRKKSKTFKKSKENCLFLNITDIKNKQKIYIHISSKKGSMPEKLFFKFLDQVNNTKSIKEKYKMPYKKDVSKTTSKSTKTSKNKKTLVNTSKREFHYYYEIEKQPGANFLYIRYTNFKGESLEIENYEPNNVYIFLIVFGVIFVIILIIIGICVGNHLYTKKQEAIMEENYKSSFVDENNYINNTVN